MFYFYSTKLLKLFFLAKMLGLMIFYVNENYIQYLISVGIVNVVILGNKSTFGTMLCEK